MTEPKAETARTGRDSSFVLGPVIDWSAVAATVRALASTATPEGLASLERLVMGLTDPLRRLDALASLAQRAVDGDDNAADALRSALASVNELAPMARGLSGRFVGDEDLGKRANARCDCGDERHHSVIASGGEREITVAYPDVLDEAGVVALVLAITRIYASEPPRARTEALDAIVALLVAADTFASLARAYRAAGSEGLLHQLELVGARGQLAGMSGGGGMPIRSGFGGPNVPDFPGGWPGGDSLPKPPGMKAVEEILAAIKNRKGWGPEIWEPVVELVRDPVAYLPAGWLSHLACLREVYRRIAARAAIPPPARPARVTWTDGIASIVLSGPCAGDTLVIHGAGFAALRQTAVLLLPFADGCHPVAVPAASWTDAAITVTLPIGVVSGPIGFADVGYIAAYAVWVDEQNRLADEIRQFRCYRLGGHFTVAEPFGECPPDIGVNHLRAGTPIIRSFAANGQPLSVVEPGTSVVLSWTVRNAEQVKVTRVSNVGPQFGGSSFIVDPAGASYGLGPFVGDRPQEARYELLVTGPCGTVTASVAVRLRKVPVLQIVGVEVTQAIQTFRDPNAPPNSIPLVALKDTIVRVYVAVENLGGFKPDGSAPNEVGISGEALVSGGPLLPPLGQAKARPSASIERWKTDNTINFRIPASLASGSKTIRIKVWAVDEVETPPVGIKTRPAAWPVYHPVTWIDKAPFKVRYVRISHDAIPLLSDQAAREVVLRAFDLLATPPTDIAAARIPTWNTSLDLATRDGISDLLGHIDDQHDCTFSEWLFPWEDECPDADGAVWVGVTSRTEWGGMAQAHRWFNTSRNTAIVPPERVTAAHELGHTLSLNHVNPNVTGGLPFDDDTDFDTLPNGGGIQRGDAFDPAAGQTVNGIGLGIVDLYDFMSYAVYRWVSPANRQRVFDKF